MSAPTRVDLDHLGERLRALARVPVLLIASDYDGTLAPIVDDPAAARPQREAVVALRALASSPDTHVAVISGRSLRDLATMTRFPEEIHLVGSHGSEFDAGFATALSPVERTRQQRLSRLLHEVSAGDPGFSIEPKPAGAAFHYRNADAAAGDAAVGRILAALSEDERGDGVHVRHGKKVLELSVVNTHKGVALERLRRQLGAEAVIFVGDDTTDEDAFATLHGPDLGIKVGDGPTLAEFRIADPSVVAQVLARLWEHRRAWLEGADAPEIERHSLLSDQRTVALITPDARVSWLCHPRADSPAVFAELLGGPSSGFFAVAAENGSEPISQRYLPDTLVLETRWADFTVTDYLDVSGGRIDEPPGRTDLIRVVEGRGRARVIFAPRPDFGRALAHLTVLEDGVALRGSQPMELHAPGVEWQLRADGQNETAEAVISLEPRHPLVLELRFDPHPGGPRPAPADEPARRAATVEYWRTWASGLELPGVADDDVRRSALTLRALCYRPTGAILAAATTSLPEVVGGVRNWDYRLCWPRDASLSAAALVELGSTEEAMALLDWLQARVDHLPGPEQLRPLYPVTGDDFAPEGIIPTLHGYRGSRPVRIGNAAEHQVQLDVFGPVVDLVWRLVRRDVPLADGTWRLVEDMVTAVSRRWHEPDHGSWEEQRAPRHHVHSKVMCWQAVDRAIRIAKHLDRTVPAGWRTLRHLIAADVVEHGWNDRVNAYTVAYGDDEMDAAVLHIGLSGLLPTIDPRFVATVRAMERELRSGSMVYRYRFEDGLPGVEGGFLICTSWLIEAYARMGAHDDARLLFERYCDLAGPTGLLAEEYDPIDERALGNHPQAYSHLGLILAAVALREHGVMGNGVMGQ